MVERDRETDKEGVVQLAVCVCVCVNDGEWVLMWGGGMVWVWGCKLTRHTAECVCVCVGGVCGRWLLSPGCGLCCVGNRLEIMNLLQHWGPASPPHFKTTQSPILYLSA